MIKCPACKSIDKYIIEKVPVDNHPNLEIDWYVCECGEEIKPVNEIDEFALADDLNDEKKLNELTKKN